MLRLLAGLPMSGGPTRSYAQINEIQARLRQCAHNHRWRPPTLNLPTYVYAQAK